MKCDDHKTVSYCTAIDSGVNITAQSPEGEAEATSLMKCLDEYFKQFSAPVVLDEGNALLGGQRCLNCDAVLSGVLGSFQWGIAHGEGTCSSCGWPARAYHRPKDQDGEEICDGALQVILQYHPDNVHHNGAVND